MDACDVFRDCSQKGGVGVGGRGGSCRARELRKGVLSRLISSVELYRSWGCLRQAGSLLNPHIRQSLTVDPSEEQRCVTSGKSVPARPRVILQGRRQYPGQLGNRATSLHGVSHTIHFVKFEKTYFLVWVLEKKVEKHWFQRILSTNPWERK